MTLDAPRNWRDAELLEKPAGELSEPEWVRLARATEADRRERERREAEELDAIESIDAEESRWAGVFRRQAAERPVEHWSDNRRGIDRRQYGVERDRGFAS